MLCAKRRHNFISKMFRELQESGFGFPVTVTLMHPEANFTEIAAYTNSRTILLAVHETHRATCTHTVLHNTKKPIDRVRPSPLGGAF